MGEVIAAFLVAMSIPSTITGLLVWWLKKHIDKRDKKRYDRESNTEQLILLIAQNSRSTYRLVKATAKAVQRIPDAHCNGDMTYALEQAEKFQREEQEFLIDQGIKRVFGD